jgi:hypothetical protein
MSKSDKFIQTYGFNALKRTLDNMSQQGQRKILIPALRRAVKGTLDMARMNVPKGRTHNLEKSLRIMTDTAEIAVIVGARKGGGYKGYAGHLLDKGTKLRSYTTKNGVKHNTGMLKTNKPYFEWFTRAAKVTERDAVNKLAVEWQRGVARCIIRNIYDS